MASNLTPATQAPDGRVSNLINPTGVGYRITITNIVCIVLFMIVVVVRLITRIFLNRSFGHDDCKRTLSAAWCNGNTDLESSTHSIRYCIILSHHGRLPMDGITRTRKTPLGRITGKLFAQFPPRLAHGSCTLLSMHAYHEAVRAHAIPSTLPYPELSYSVVVRILLCQCLQRDVHLCIAILLLADLSSMVRTGSYILHFA